MSKAIVKIGRKKIGDLIELSMDTKKGTFEFGTVDNIIKQKFDFNGVYPEYLSAKLLYNRGNHELMYENIQEVGTKDFIINFRGLFSLYFEGFIYEIPLEPKGVSMIKFVCSKPIKVKNHANRNQ